MKIKTRSRLLLLLHSSMFVLASGAHAFGQTESAAASDSSAQAVVARELAMQAMGLIGVPYKYGGDDPASGFDCSGLVRYLFKEAGGAELPRSAEQMSQLGEQVETHELQAGDLLFYNTLKRAFSHVGIYLGDDKFIHAPSSGGQVRIESMNISYWKNRFDGARRLPRLE